MKIDEDLNKLAENLLLIEMDSIHHRVAEGQLQTILERFDKQPKTTTLGQIVNKYVSEAHFGLTLKFISDLFEDGGYEFTMNQYAKLDDVEFFNWKPDFDCCELHTTREDKNHAYTSGNYLSDWKKVVQIPQVRTTYVSHEKMVKKDPL